MGCYSAIRFVHDNPETFGEDTPLGDPLRRPRWGVPCRFDIEHPSFQSLC